MSKANREVLRRGAKRARKLITTHLYACMGEAADEILRDLEENKGYQGFTGNTQTSYSVGLYVDGELSDVAVQGRWNAPPVRLKVRYRSTVYLKKPYEGQRRAETGRVKVDSQYGQDTATDILQAYKKAPQRGIALKVTTGTEYSRYLETVRDMNVMTATWTNAKDILKKELKPMK